MSISLAMIPVALTLRLVMGKNNFNRWIESMQMKEPTTFASEQELIRTVRKAGYDAERRLGSIKTHIDGEKLFFFWEQGADGVWQAVFGKSDAKDKLAQFMSDVNRAAGRAIFGATAEAAIGLEDAAQATIAASPPTFPTNFRDGELLFRTLKEFGLNPLWQGSELLCKVEQSLLTFRQTGDQPFEVEIRDAPDLRKMFEYLSDVDDDYKRCVQDVVYKKLKQRAAEKNMTVESEEVLEDNSIVITLNIRE